MRLEDMEQEFPQMPEEMRTMIEREVEKQVNTTSSIGFEKKKHMKLTFYFCHTLHNCSTQLFKICSLFQLPYYPNITLSLTLKNVFRHVNIPKQIFSFQSMTWICYHVYALSYIPLKYFPSF